MKNALLIIFSAELMLLLSGVNAFAQMDPWEFEVYPYATESRGVLELETDNAVVANGHNQGGSGVAAGDFASQSMWYNGNELTYGLTDRIEAAAYLNFSQVSGHGFWYAGNKFRLRGRLFDEGTLPIDLGWYLEFEYHKSSTIQPGNLN